MRTSRNTTHRLRLRLPGPRGRGLLPHPVPQQGWDAWLCALWIPLRPRVAQRADRDPGRVRHGGGRIRDRSPLGLPEQRKRPPRLQEQMPEGQELRARSRRRHPGDAGGTGPLKKPCGRRGGLDHMRATSRLCWFYRGALAARQATAASDPTDCEDCPRDCIAPATTTLLSAWASALASGDPPHYRWCAKCADAHPGALS